MKRYNYIDIFKGILIVLVVCGHEISEMRFVYWFHMPLFFMISGFLQKKTQINIKGWFFSKISRFMIPYFAYYFLITITGLNNNFGLSQFIKLIWGGRQSTGVLAVWWYPTCLFITLFLIQLILKIKSKSIQYIIAISLYVVGILEWKFFLPSDVNQYTTYNKLPWNVDVSLAMVIFVLMGYYLKPYIKNLLELIVKKQIIFVICSVIMIISICLVFQISTETFWVDIKYSQYGDPVLLIVFTLLWGMPIMIISKLLGKFKITDILFKTIGFHSMTIMYLHMPLLFLFRNLIPGEELTIQIIRCMISLLICLMVGITFNHFRITQILFITGNISTLIEKGKNRSSKKSDSVDSNCE